MTQTGEEQILEQLTLINRQLAQQGQNLEQQAQRLDQQTERLDQQIERLDKLERQQEISNKVVETYQKASQQVVNLAFGLIATAAGTIILQAVLLQRS